VLTADHLDAEPRSASGAGRMIRIIVILFCVEVGLILLLLPWSLLWDNNFFFSLAPQWNQVWLNFYTRGAVSGLGVVNLWIAATEAMKLSR
jgi:hypothetical protein